MTSSSAPAIAIGLASTMQVQRSIILSSSSSPLRGIRSCPFSHSRWRRRSITRFPLFHLQNVLAAGDQVECGQQQLQRREVIVKSFSLGGVGWMSSFLNLMIDSPRASASAAASLSSDFADMPALRGKDYGKTKMRYPDYTLTESGLQFKDLRVGSGPTPKLGETVVVDWDGYTIGYYGRIFEARNKTKGGSFEGDDKDFFKFKIGSQQVIPAFEEAVSGMALSGIRRIIVPPELGYPENDFNKMGPRPTTFSGQRALDFVLRNQGLIDKTLLFDIELLKIIPK